MVKLVIAPGMSGYTGIRDCINTQYMLNAKTSIWATTEQNRKLEEGLMLVYEAYLQEVANSNNGRY